MDDGSGVSRLERLRDLLKEPERFVDGERGAGQSFLKGLTRNELHDEVGDVSRPFEPVERRDARMIQGRQYPRFPLETGEALLILPESLGKHFDGDLASELPVPGLVDLAHPPLPDGRQDLVQAQFGSS